MSARQRHEDLTTSYIKVRGHPEPRKVPATIPDSFANLAKAASQDGNKLQHKCNIHEHALDWIRIFEESKQKLKQPKADSKISCFRAPAQRSRPSPRRQR